MDLLKEILIELISKSPPPQEFRNLEDKLLAAVNQQCFTALEKIKAIIEDDSLSDFECVEDIVTVLEELGSDGGCRHDFG